MAVFQKSQFMDKIKGISALHKGLNSDIEADPGHNTIKETTQKIAKFQHIISIVIDEETIEIISKAGQAGSHTGDAPVDLPSDDSFDECEDVLIPMS